MSNNQGNAKGMAQGQPPRGSSLQGGKPQTPAAKPSTTETDAEKKRNAPGQPVDNGTTSVAEAQKKLDALKADYREFSDKMQHVAQTREEFDARVDKLADLTQRSDDLMKDLGANNPANYAHGPAGSQVLAEENRMLQQNLGSQGQRLIVDGRREGFVSKEDYFAPGGVVDRFLAGMKMASMAGLSAGAFRRASAQARELLAMRRSAGRSAKPAAHAEEAHPAQPKKAEPGAKARKRQEEEDEHKKQSQPCDEQKGTPSGCITKVSANPVDFGSGEEILHHADFDIATATLPIDWTRCYRSSNAGLHHSPLGARWISPYTTRISAATDTLVYHDANGRTVHMRPLDIGESEDHPFESFVLSRPDAATYTLTYRNGTVDTFTPPACSALATDVWPLGAKGLRLSSRPVPVPLPHLPPPEVVQCFYLSRSQLPNGHALSLAYAADTAPADAPLLRITDGAGLVLECLRDTSSPEDAAAPPRIAAIERVWPDGTRTRLATYLYQRVDASGLTGDPAGHLSSPTPGTPDELAAGGQSNIVSAPAAGPDHDFGTHQAFGWMAHDATAATTASLPAQPLPRYDLVAHTNAAGHRRTYRYHHHLLTRYTTFGGYVHGLEWQGPDALYTDAPGTIDAHTSHWARAVRTFTSDGAEPVAIQYVDADTTIVTQPDGTRMRFVFDANNLCTGLFILGGPGIPEGAPPHSQGTRTWDANGNLLSNTDAAGRTSRYRYDAAGNLVEATDPGGAATQVVYGPRNLPVRITDALGHTITREYDAHGNLTAQTDALGRTTRYTYDSQGRLTEVRDALGKVKTLAYVASGAAAGQLHRYTDCSGIRTQYEYDAHARLARLIEAEGTAQARTTSYAYDILGNLVELTHPDQTTERFAYDADGNLAAHTDAEGHVTRYAYNGQGLPIERIDAKGQTLRYRYNAALQLVVLVNQNGEETTFAYDALGQLVQENGFDGKVTRYEYDAAGELVASESNGLRIDYQRDPLGRLLAKITPQGIVRYAYDPLGRLVAAASGDNARRIAQGQAGAEHRFTYDAAGQLTQERHAVRDGDVQAAFLLTHEYDALGNRIRTRLPNGKTVETLRYGSGHWHGTLLQGQSIVDLERDALHRETRRHLAGSRTPQAALTIDKHYDPQSRLTQAVLARGETVLRRRDYRYSANGHLLQIADSRHGTLHYRYDPLGQLLEAAQPEVTERFAFDPAGNLLDVPQQEQPAAEEHLARPVLPKVTHNLLQQYLGYRYEYDTHGNTVRKVWQAAPAANEAAAPLALQYDADQRLVCAIRLWQTEEHHPVRRQVAHYRYDAFGRRIAKRVVEETYAAGTIPGEDKPQHRTERRTLFVWDGDVLLQEIQPDKTVTYLYEPDSFVPLARVETAEGIAAYPRSSVALAPVAVWNVPDSHQVELEMSNDGAAFATHVGHYRREQQWQQAQVQEAEWQQRMVEQASATTATVHYYECDHLGTPLALLDTEGRPVWEANYRAWGRVHRLRENRAAQPLRFQGQYEDAETGLFYNRYRYYDPDTARYLTQDPIGLIGGSNLYKYAPNPVNWIDPLGLTTVDCPKGSVRREQTPGDVDLPSARAARRAAMRSQNIPTSQSYTSVVKKDPNSNNGIQMLKIEEIRVGGRNTGGATTIGTLKVHPDGHQFPATEKTPYPTHELPHYHGNCGEHLSYSSGNPRSTNQYGM